VASQQGRGLVSTTRPKEGHPASHRAHLALIERELMVIQANLRQWADRSSGRSSQGRKVSSRRSGQQDIGNSHISTVERHSGASSGAGQNAAQGAGSSQGMGPDTSRSRLPPGLGAATGDKMSGEGGGGPALSMVPDAGRGVLRADGCARVAAQHSSGTTQHHPATLSFGSSWSGSTGTVMLRSSSRGGTGEQHVPVNGNNKDRKAAVEESSSGLQQPTPAPLAAMSSDTSTATGQGSNFLPASASGTSGSGSQDVQGGTNSSRAGSGAATSTDVKGAIIDVTSPELSPPASQAELHTPADYIPGLRLTDVLG
jgi:hypothetical protein